MREKSPLESNGSHKRLTFRIFARHFACCEQRLFLGFCGFFGVFPCFFVSVGAVYAAERGFFPIYYFSVSAFVDFAAAVSANVKAGFNGYCD